MDAVPMLFIESICALLSKDSIRRLKGCRSAVWQKGAEHMLAVMKGIHITVRVPSRSEPPLYRYNIWESKSVTPFRELRSLNDLRKIRYARVSIGISSRNLAAEESANVDGIKLLFTSASARNVESLCMYGVYRFPSLFLNFFPCSVNTIKIWKCTFGADSTFAQWLRRTLRLHSLQELTAEWITVEGRKEDVEEDLLHQLLMYGKGLNITLAGNYNFTNLNAKSLQNVLDLWMNLEKPFPRAITYGLPHNCDQIFNFLLSNYFKNEEILRHKSGSGMVTWNRIYAEITFTP
uniref:FBD domain-containing protein n=1 Tax=Steinernema glaseri TaxID=37863 RepID=A0A1I7YTP7_9BILA